MTLTSRRDLAILAVLAVSGCTSTPSSSEADVQAAIEAFYTAVKRGDAAGAMSHVADDAMFVESGRLETRAEYEANHLPADIAFEKQVDGRRSAWRITIEGNTAWAIATTEYNGTFDGSPVNFVSAQLAALTQQEGRWLIRSIHWSSRRL